MYATVASSCFTSRVYFVTCLPRYKLKAEALEAANHFVESFFRTMAQEELNRNDMVSLIWDTANDNIKCEISAFGSIKLERKRGGDIFMCIQDGTLEFEYTRIPLRSFINIRKVFST